MPFKTRPSVESDIEQVVGLALRAWAPVHESMAKVLGESVAYRVYPDWAQEQAADVRKAFRSAEVWVAADNTTDAALGFVTLVFDKEAKSGEIDMVAVDPSRQGEGIGLALTQLALAAMKTRGCTLAELTTGGDPGHAAARALYERAGFTGLPLVHYYQVL